MCEHQCPGERVTDRIEEEKRTADLMRQLQDNEISQLISLALIANTNLKHDLTSPVSAIASAMDILDHDQESEFRETAVMLIKSSVEQLSLRLDTAPSSMKANRGLTCQPLEVAKKLVSAFSDVIEIKVRENKLSNCAYVYPEPALLALQFELVQNAIKHRVITSKKPEIILEYHPKGHELNFSLHDECSEILPDLGTSFQFLERNSFMRAARRATRPAMEVGIDLFKIDSGISHIHRILSGSSGDLSARKSLLLAGNEVRVRLKTFGTLNMGLIDRGNYD